MGQEILHLFRQSEEKAVRSRPRIGTMLLAKKWISAEQLREALEAQRQHGKKVGHWLVELGHITEEKLIMVISEQMRLPWMSEIKQPFREDALSAIPKTLCKRFNVFPLEFAKNDHLVLAVDCGFTDEMIDAVEEVLGCKVKPFLTRIEVIKGLVSKRVDSWKDNTTDVIAERMNFANRVGRQFVKRWFDFEAERARLGLFEDTLWIRYLKGEEANDHFVFFGEDSTTAAPDESVAAVG
jgi:hypothetical protein